MQGSRLIDVARFDSAAWAGDAAREAYLEMISHTLRTGFLAEPFHARIAAGYLESVHVIGSTISPRLSERTSALIEQDRYDGVSVQLAVAGRATGTAAGRAVVSEPGTVMILDFAQSFAIRDGDVRETINFAFPRSIFAARFGDPRELHGLVVPADRAALLAAHMTTTCEQLAELPAGVGAKLGEIALELLAIALERAETGHDPGRLGRREALSARARRLIDARLGSTELTPDRLMTQLNVSRSELYSLFEDAGGVSRYIWRRRLEAARAALTNPADRRRVSEVAFAHGFSSDAHFSRAFRQQFGTTPSAARRGRE